VQVATVSRLASRLARARTEFRGLLVLAIPIMIAQLSYAAMGFVDTVMSGQVSAQDLAAVALGNSLWVPVFLLMTGTLLATTPKVAQRFGARQDSEIPPLVHQALWLALGIGALCGTALWNAEAVLQLMQVEPSLIEPAMGYLRAVACGFPAIALFHVLRCYSDGLGMTRPTMVLAVIGLLLNIPLNYIFIYGKFGLPAMGGVGCGWATSLVMLVTLLGMLGWVSLAPHYRNSRVLRQFQWPQLAVIRRLLSVGLPIGISVFAESSIFAVIALLIGAMGATMVAGHQIALNFSSMVFMIPYSLGMAVTVRVGHALGAGSPRGARFAAAVGMATALIYACLSSSAMLLLREQIAQIYTDNPAVIAIAGSLLIYAAIFQFSDAIQVTAAGALRGYQDTRIAMLFTLFAYWGIGLPVGYSLGLSEQFGVMSGPVGLWQGLVVGLTSAAFMLGIRLVLSARRRIRLSEQLSGAPLP
jgi:MATE family multidrug resistance protein